jgi:hypothetical protein
MPELKRGTFSLHLGVFQVEAELSEEDRQCAWELYTEAVTRVAVVGKLGDPSGTDFAGEVLAESLDLLHAFFTELRAIMRRFPVGRLSRDRTYHLGVLINDLIVNTLRPFLERWQADFRHWWGQQGDHQLSPIVRQQAYPYHAELVGEWRDLRLLVRDLLKVLVDQYRLVDVRDQPRLLGSAARRENASG